MKHLPGGVPRLVFKKTPEMPGFTKMTLLDLDKFDKFEFKFNEAGECLGPGETVSIVSIVHLRHSVITLITFYRPY